MKIRMPRREKDLLFCGRDCGGDEDGKREKEGERRQGERFQVLQERGK